MRHPISLPRRNCVTKLTVKEYHERGNHATGTKQTLAALSTRYWLLAGREEIREWEKECRVCRRRKSKPCSKLMAPLPTSRLKPSLRAFVRSAADFAGFHEEMHSDNGTIFKGRTRALSRTRRAFVDCTDPSRRRNYNSTSEQAVSDRVGTLTMINILIPA